MFIVVGFIGRIHSLHAKIETDDEIVKVKAQAESIANGNLRGEIFQGELSTRLFLVIAQSPDVAGIHEEGTTQFPK